MKMLTFSLSLFSLARCGRWLSFLWFDVPCLYPPVPHPMYASLERHNHWLDGG